MHSDVCNIIAAHAVAGRLVDEVADFQGLEENLPDQATIVVTYPNPRTSYWEVVITGGSSFDGTFEDWYIDTDRTISSGTSYTANVFSSYDEGFEGLGLVEYPKNMTLVNYVITQDWVGKAAACGGTYTYGDTYGDVQRSIWTLIEDTLALALGSNAAWIRSSGMPKPMAWDLSLTAERMLQ